MSEEYVLIFINIIVVPALVLVYKYLVNKRNWIPGEIHLSVVFSVIALALSYAFGQDFFAGLPPLSGNLLEFVAAFIEGLGALVGAALLLYNVISDKFFDGIKSRLRSFGRRLLG